jgi:DNA-binding beta-propeller fold protein YncE
MLRLSVFLLLILLSIRPAALLAQTPAYQFIKKISLPTGDGKWDYLTLVGEHLYVSHADRIHIVDVTTEAQIGEISGLKGLHGVAIANHLHKGYISSGAENAITIFDDRTFKVLKTLIVPGKKADAIMFDKGANRVFVFNNGNGSAVAIDVTTDTVAGEVEMGGKCESGVSNGKGSIFNNNEGTQEIVEFDARTMAIKNRYSLAPNKIPTGIAFDAATNRLFTGCRDPHVLMILDATNGRVIQTLPIGGNVDAVVYDKAARLIMTSNGEGNVTIVRQESADKYSVVQTLTTQPGIKTMALHPKTHRIYLSGADLQADGKTLVPGTFGVYVYGQVAN